MEKIELNQIQINAILNELDSTESRVEELKQQLENYKKTSTAEINRMQDQIEIYDKELLELKSNIPSRYLS